MSRIRIRTEKFGAIAGCGSSWQPSKLGDGKVGVAVALGYGVTVAVAVAVGVAVGSSGRLIIGRMYTVPMRTQAAAQCVRD